MAEIINCPLNTFGKCVFYLELDNFLDGEDNTINIIGY